MSSITFGLGWKHPAVLLNVSAILLDILYEIVAVYFVRLPSGISIYYRLPLGGVAMAGMSLYCLSESDSRIGSIVGYGMAVLNILCALGFLVVGVAYIMGPGSGLWRLVVSE
jgi:multidrug transporter EmrE-like cation transporter